MLLVKVIRPFVEFDETLALAMFLSALEGLQSMLLRAYIGIFFNLTGFAQAAQGL